MPVMSSRLQSASECRHRIQVTDKGHTDKANLHKLIPHLFPSPPGAATLNLPLTCQPSLEALSDTRAIRPRPHPGLGSCAPYSASSCTVCFKSSAFSCLIPCKALPASIEFVSGAVGSSRLWAGESMLRKASSNPAGLNRARTRSQGERITNACGLNLGRNTHSPASHLESFLSHVHVELSFQNVEELVLARVHMWRRFASRC